MQNFIRTIINPENEFFELAKSGKRITHISLSSFILPVLFIIIAALLTQNVFAPLYFGDPKLATSTAREVFGLYSLFFLIIVNVFLWVKFFERRPFHTIGFTKDNALRKYLFGFTSGFILNLTVIALLAIFGSIDVSSESNTEMDTYVIGGVLVFLLGYIIQGASEEILTRGWMFQVIGARYKPWLGVLITSIIFSIMHLGNDGANIFAAINIFLIAIFLSLFVMKDSSIWGACGFHSAWNWTLGNVFGLSVSGTRDKTSLFDLTTKGNELLTGGQFGVEGSIVLTFLLIGSIFLLIRYLIKKGDTYSVN